MLPPFSGLNSNTLEIMFTLQKTCIVLKSVFPLRRHYATNKVSLSERLADFVFVVGICGEENWNVSKARIIGRDHWNARARNERSLFTGV